MSISRSKDFLLNLINILTISGFVLTKFIIFSILSAKNRYLCDYLSTKIKGDYYG